MVVTSDMELLLGPLEERFLVLSVMLIVTGVVLMLGRTRYAGSWAGGSGSRVGHGSTGARVLSGGTGGSRAGCVLSSSSGHTGGSHG